MNVTDADFIAQVFAHVPAINSAASLLLPDNDAWDAEVKAAQDYLARIDDERDEDYRADAAAERERMFPSREE